MHRGIHVVFAFVLCLLSVSPVLAQSSPDSNAAKAACKALEGDFGQIVDAPTHVTLARLMEATTSEPAYCQVQAYIAPNIGFELHLPAAAWNGKFAEVGCGGYCGTLYTFLCENVVSAGYACVVSDMGHKSSNLDAKWAFNNLQAEVDFAYRSTHVVALAGKALTEHYYGKAASRSYYMGCSTGGRQGMVEAQRFPDDFDGIIAGAPVIDETGDALGLLWNVQATIDSTGKSILTTADVLAVHDAAVAACDMDDGVKDGIISNPRQCAFDPGTMLPAEKAAAVRKIYGGARNAKGELVYVGRALPGSELNWVQNYVGENGKPSTYFTFMTDMFRYMNFVPDPGPTWTLSQFDWEKDPKRLGMMEALYSGANPDLRKFKAKGGKLIVYQGWADQSVLPEKIVDYYEVAENTMGGRAATQSFFRLFMVPGMNHCIGGHAADTADYLRSLEAWVERGEAPDVVMAMHAKPGAKPNNYLWAPPTLTGSQVEFARPLYPYPLQARYKGRGDPNDAGSFKPVELQR